MLDARILKTMIVLILASYFFLIALSQIEPFKKAWEKGGFQPFENILLIGVFFVMFYGIWVNGYEEGLKNGKN